MRSRAVCALASVVAITGAGCGQSAPVTTRPIPAPGGGVGVRPAPQDARALNLAGDMLTERCMRRHGLVYVVMPQPAEKADPPLLPYGDDDVEAARREGYGFPPAPTPQAEQAAEANDPNARYIASLSSAEVARYDRVMYGGDGETVDTRLPTGYTVTSHLGGCWGEAQRGLYGDELSTFVPTRTLVENLESLVEQRVLADPAYGAALGDWRRCMRRRGYAFADLGAATSAAREHPGREREIAVADRTCAQEVALVKTGNRLDRAHRAEVIDEYAGGIAAYRERTDAATARAEQVIAGGSPR